ncbi:MAG TPA: hypothetical protein P5076_12645, partial [Myxococcota bacterium]|nr:hypothetical protein [Myxococcota bacterium]
METVKKHFWAVNLLFLAGWAWMLAGSINGVIAHKLRELPALTGASPAKARAGREDVLTASNQIIIERNYFGSAMAKPLDTIETGAELDEDRAQKLLDDEGLGVESSLRAALVGTIVAEPVDWSMAMITDLAASETGVYRI